MRKEADVARWFVKAYPMRSLLAVGCLVLAGFFEGFGIAAMLPLVRIVLTPEASSESSVSQAMEGLFRAAGFDLSAGFLIVFIIVVLACKAGFLLLAYMQVGYTAARVTRDMRLRLIRGLMGVRWRFFTTERTGTFTAAISSEAQRGSAAFLALCNMLAGLIQITIYLVLAFTLSWVATAFALAVSVLTMFILSHFVSIARQSGKAKNVLMRSFNHRLIEGLHAMKPVKAMAQEQRLLPLLEQEISGLDTAQRRQILSRHGLNSLQEPLVAASIGVALYVMLGTWTGRVEVLFGLLLLFVRSVMRINRLQREYQGFVQAEPAFQFMRSLLESLEQQAEVRRGWREPKFERAITFDRVSFAYEGERILEETSIEIKASEITTITGESGSGKTTTVDLVMGLLTPEKGDILVDGVPLRELDLRKWRQKIGYVPQDAVMFYASVRDNITLGDRNISEEQVWKALTRAGAAHFIKRMPEGVDTVVGERGMKVSGGERQRISIARALVRDPQLLVLDEATSSLDPGTEASICKTLLQLEGSLTVLAISHQPALAEIARRVFRVERGRVEQCYPDGSSAVDSVIDGGRQ